MRGGEKSGRKIDDDDDRNRNTSIIKETTPKRSTGRAIKARIWKMFLLTNSRREINTTVQQNISKSYFWKMNETLYKLD